MSLVAQVWWCMRQANTPLSSVELYERVLDNFGDHPRLKSKTGFYKLLNHLKPEVFRKIEGSYRTEYEVVKDVPFNQALRFKFLTVIDPQQPLLTASDKGKLRHK